MIVKFKKLHPDAVLPKHSKHGDAGMDLTTVITEETIALDQIKHRYGISVEIPEGHVGLIFPRSSICNVHERLTNSVGVIDSGYRGELSAVFESDGEVHGYDIGDRTAQLVVVPYVNVQSEWAEELSKTSRGEGGYGSTGK